MARGSAARQDRLAAMLRERGELGVDALRAGLAVSEATVRRDLAALESAGVLARTFGGARLREEASGTRSLACRASTAKRFLDA